MLSASLSVVQCSYQYLVLLLALSASAEVAAVASATFDRAALGGEVSPAHSPRGSKSSKRGKEQSNEGTAHHEPVYSNYTESSSGLSRVPQIKSPIICEQIEPEQWQEHDAVVMCCA